MAPSALVASYLKHLSDHMKNLPVAFQGGPGDPEVWGKRIVELWVSDYISPPFSCLIFGNSFRRTST